MKYKLFIPYIDAVISTLVEIEKLDNKQGANKIGRRNASDILGSCVMRFRPGAERC